MNKTLRKLSTIRQNAEAIAVNGKNYLVLYRDSPKKSTRECPFCGKRHKHGDIDGHRITHCESTDADFVIGRNVVFKNKSGLIFDSSDGYIVKSCPKQH